MADKQVTVNVNLSLVNYHAARRRAAAAGLSLRAWARQALIAAVKAATDADRERRRVEVMETWPKLADLVESDPRWRTVVDRYVELSAVLLDLPSYPKSEHPSQDDFAWVCGVEGLLNREVGHVDAR